MHYEAHICEILRFSTILTDVFILRWAIFPKNNIHSTAQELAHTMQQMDGHISNKWVIASEGEYSSYKSGSLDKLYQFG